MDERRLVPGSRVLITGSAGFLGSELANFFVGKGIEVHGIDIHPGRSQPGIRMYRVDLMDEQALKEVVKLISPDYVYHLAASLNRQRDFKIANQILDINLSGTVNLLNALKDVAFEKIVFVSTSEVYGGKMAKSPFVEEGDYVPASPYSLSKYCAEMALKTFSAIYAKNYTILRLFNFFGKSMPEDFFISQLVQKMRSNEAFNMTAGAQKRDFVYIKDVLEALYLASSDKANQQTFNVSSGTSISIKQLALQLKEFLNSKSVINFGAIPYRENEIWDMSGDIRKIKACLGWSPKYAIEEALEDMIDTGRTV